MPSKLRTLFILREVPYPVRGGSSLRSWQLINLMARRGTVALFSACNWTPKNQTLPLIEWWCHCNVEEQRSAWERFNRHFWWLFPKRHHSADWNYSVQAAQALAQLLRDFKPDLVILEQAWMYPYLKVVRSYPCQIIVDNQNVEAHLHQQLGPESQPDQSRLKARLKYQLEQNHLKRLERAFCRAGDQVWVCSPEDASLVRQWYGQELQPKVIPNGIDVSYYDEVWQGKIPSLPALGDKRHNLLFLGQLSYPPNQEAVDILLDRLYPALKVRYPDCRLLLIGRTPTVKMLTAAAQDANIIVSGMVADVRPYLASASVQVVPLISGGGTRLKILEALAAGCPVISTQKGAEGLSLSAPFPLILADRDEEILAAIAELWDNPILAENLARLGYEWAKTYYDWSAIDPAITAAIAELSISVVSE